MTRSVFCLQMAPAFSTRENKQKILNEKKKKKKLLPLHIRQRAIYSSSRCQPPAGARPGRTNTPATGRYSPGRHNFPPRARGTGACSGAVGPAAPPPRARLGRCGPGSEPPRLPQGPREGGERPGGRCGSPQPGAERPEGASPGSAAGPRCSQPGPRRGARSPHTHPPPSSSSSGSGGRERGGSPRGVRAECWGRGERPPEPAGQPQSQVGASPQRQKERAQEGAAAARSPAYLCLRAEGGPGALAPVGAGRRELVPGRRRSGAGAGCRWGSGRRPALRRGSARLGSAGWGSAQRAAASPRRSQPAGFSGAKSTFSCGFRRSAPHETHDAARLPHAGDGKKN